jgi:HK97 gp10 family phage protein
MTVRAKFTGAKELEAALRDLGSKATAKRVAVRALTRAAEPIRDKAIQNAPDDPKSGLGKYLRESIKIGKKAGQSRGFKRSMAGGDTAEVWVGIDGNVLPAKAPKTERRRNRKGGGSSGGGVAAYSIFVEKGTSSMAPQPFMEPAWHSEKMTAFNRLGADLWAEIDKAAARQARKKAKGG